MISVTFFLQGRSKTFTRSSLQACWNVFKEDYPEAIDEVKQVKITRSDNTETLCELSHFLSSNLIRNL